MVFAISEQGTQYQEVRAMSNCLARNQTTVSEQLAYSRTVVSVSYHYKDQTKHVAGADPGFQVRGGALKKIAPSVGRRKNFWGISCEKSRFYAKKIIFFQILGGAPPGSAPVLV